METDALLDPQAVDPNKEDRMQPNDALRPQDDLDHALSDLLQYLGLQSMVAAELNVLARPVNKVIAALLISQEAHGELSPYRQHLLERIRQVDVGEQRAIR
jgi:hypothetical protein